jgi:hypothetical protein
MKSIMLAGCFLAMVALVPEDNLTGRWETKPSVNGNVTGVVFKRDSSFEGFINKKPFTSGRYVLEDSIIRFTDNGCDGAEAVYRIIFFHQGDSMRWVPVRDDCRERREGITRLVLGRVKKEKI